MREGFTIAFTNQASNRRRYRFERREVGGWLRVEEERTIQGWQQVGQEIVADLDVEVARPVTGEFDVVDEPVTISEEGP